MSKYFSSALICAVVIVCADSAFAETTTANLPTSYSSAIQFAIANRQEIAIEQQSVNSAHARVKEIQGTFSPSVDAFFTGSNIRSHDDFSGLNVNARFNGTNVPVVVTSFTPRYQLSSGVELNYNIYSGGLNEARLAEANELRHAAYAHRDLWKKKIVLDVTYAYWALRKAQYSIQRAEQNLSFVEAELAVAEEQYRLGQISKTELEVKVYGREVKAADLRNERRALTTFERRYAYSLGSNVIVRGDFPTLTQHPGSIDPGLFLQDLGLQSHPELKKLTAELESAKARVRQLDAEYKPNFDVFVRYSAIGRSDESFSSAHDNFGRQSTIVGVRLKWNLFNGYQTSNRVSQALATIEQLRLKIKQAERDISHEAEEKHYIELDLEDQLALARKKVDLMQDQLRIAEKRFQLQRISDLQYRAVQLQVEDIANKVASLEIDLFVARMGRLLSQY